MSIRFLHVVGQNENEIMVCEEFVGPFVDQEHMERWLKDNGFEPNNPPSTISRRSGHSFFHRGKTTRSPLATEVWAQEETFIDPTSAVINDNPD